MRSSVPFKVKSVVETFTADRAQIAFDVVMATKMTGQQSLQRKDLVAYSTLELIVRRLEYCNTQHSQSASCKQNQETHAMITILHCVPKKHVTTFSTITLTIGVRLR